MRTPVVGHRGCEWFCQLDHNTCFPFLALVTDIGSDIVYRVYRDVLDTTDVCSSESAAPFGNVGHGCTGGAAVQVESIWIVLVY